MDQTHKPWENSWIKHPRKPDRGTMPTFYCYGCDAYIFIPENEEDTDCDECCESPSWVFYETKIRAQKNLKVLENKMKVFGVLLSEYKFAKERVKCGEGYYDAKNEFETLTKKRCLEIKDTESSKIQKKN